MSGKENISKQENPFKVPSGYFESFDEKLKDKIVPKENISKVSKLTILKPWLALAAAFLLLTMIYNLIPNNILNPNANLSYSSEVSEEIEAWSDECFGVNELMDYLTLKSTETSSFEIYPDSLFFGDITVEDYDLLSLTEY